MNSHRLLCPALCLLILAFPTAGLAAPVERNRVQTLGGPGEERFHAVVSSDGAVFFGGFKDGVGGLGDAWLYATDLDGTPIVDLTYQDISGRPSVIRAMDTTRRGLVAGGQLGSEGTDLDVFVMGLTEDGQIVWQLSLQLPGNQILGDVAPLGDGDVLVVGSTSSPGATRSDAWVVRLDSTGAIRWQKKLATLGEDRIHSAIETSSGDLLLAGQGGVGRQIDGYQGWVVSMDADGNLLSHQGYELAQSDRINSLVPTKRGYLGFGVAFETSFEQGQGWILELDEWGNFADSRLVGDFEQFGGDELVAGLETKAGGFIAVGNSETVSGHGQQLVAVEFDSRGVALWVRHFGTAGFNVAAGAIELRGSRGLVLAGSTQSVGAVDALQITTVTPPDDGSSCAQIGTLPVRTAPFLPRQGVPFLAVSDTAATVVPDVLVEADSDTGVDTLCAY